MLLIVSYALWMDARGCGWCARLGPLAVLTCQCVLAQVFMPRRLGLFMVFGALIENQSPEEHPKSPQARDGLANRFSSNGGVLLSSRTSFRKPNTSPPRSQPRRTVESLRQSLMGSMSGSGSVVLDPVFDFRPSADELCTVMADTFKEILAVAAHAAMGLMHYPEVCLWGDHLSGSLSYQSGQRRGEGVLYQALVQ